MKCELRDKGIDHVHCANCGGVQAPPPVDLMSSCPNCGMTDAEWNAKPKAERKAIVEAARGAFEHDDGPHIGAFPIDSPEEAKAFLDFLRKQGADIKMAMLYDPETGERISLMDAIGAKRRLN